MARICDNCGKKMTIGRQHRHKRGVAGQQWKQRAQKTTKLQKPNLHQATIVVRGIKKKMLLCTTCLRTLKKKSAGNL